MREVSISSNTLDSQAASQPDLPKYHAVCVRMRSFGNGVAMLFFLAVLISGCGFHLRGNIEMPAFLHSIYIQDKNVSRITPVLQQYMKVNDVKLTSDATSASAVLAIDGERFDRRVLSVDSAGKAREYALLYRVQFSLFDQAHQPLLNQQTIQVERDMRFDATQVLAKSSEAEQLNQDMLQDAGQQIMRRIQFVEAGPH